MEGTEPANLVAQLGYLQPPPLVILPDSTVLQFDNGARVLMEMVDIDKDGVETGQKLRMVYRIKEKDRARGYNRYFWKSTPVAAG